MVRLDENSVSLHPARLTVKHSAFLDGGELFDAAAFELRAPEVKLEDPQQRWLLDASHRALREGGADRRALRDAHVAVTVGQMSYDWLMVQGPLDSLL